MSTDYTGKLREARTLIDKGQYTLAVVLMGKLMESLYTDFYNEVLQALPIKQRQLIVQREQEFVATGDRAARDKGFAGLTFGGKAKFFRDNRFVESAESVLGRSFPRFKAFDPSMLRDIRNEATHDTEDVDEDSAGVYYSMLRLLLLEAGYLQKAEAAPETLAAGVLRSWKDAGCIPHEDILSGNLQMDSYAADLWGVARNDPNTRPVYRDAARFYAQTYLTRSLAALLDDVLSALGGGPGDRVLQLRTPFGGGKTHTLIALYHLTRHRDRLADFPELAGMPDPGPTAVAAVQCEKFPVRQGRMTEDGLHVHTLWGEIAYQLAGLDGYALLAADDEYGTAPGGETLAALLRAVNGPALILLDEVLDHVEAAQTVVVGESTLGRQLLIFLKTLTEAVAGQPQVVLVYSLQASVREGLGAETLLATLDHMVSRLDAKREPVSGDEVMRVVQRRLFSGLGSESDQEAAANAYSEAYRKLQEAGGSLTADDHRRLADDTQRLRDRILESYPFHPDLLNLMYHRWGSLPSYQRTRGALQFLASVVFDLWHQGRDLQPLVGAGDVLLDQANSRSAFFTQVGEREQYASVLSQDVTGANAKAAQVDRRIAADSPALQRFRTGTRLATAIMLYSFGGRQDGDERGVNELELLSAVAAPGLDRMILKTALDDLRAELLYLHHTGRRYRFETQPNLNKAIDDESKKFSLDEVRGRVRRTLDAALSGAAGAVIWPDANIRVPDRLPMLQVAYLPLEWGNVGQEELAGQLLHWFEYAGVTRREYKNALALAMPSYMSIDPVLAAARESLAMEAIERNTTQFNLTPELKRELAERKANALDRLARGVVQLYSQVVVPVAAPEMPRNPSAEEMQIEGHPYWLRVVDLISRNEPRLHERVLAALRDRNLLFDSLTADKLVALTGLTERLALATDDVVSQFFSFLSFTRLSQPKALAAAIAAGVRAGKLGYTAVWQADQEGVFFPNPQLVYSSQAVNEDEIDLSGGLVLEAGYARSVLPTTEPAPPLDDPEHYPPAETLAVTPLAPISAHGPADSYELTISADKKQATKVFRVLVNLLERATTMSLRVQVSAEADGGFDPVWLRNAVEEPLDEADVPFDKRLE